jgi:DNA-binding XRE family transcriptional regulator
MTTKFSDFIQEVEAEARAEGAPAAAELQAFRAYFALAHDLRALRKERGLTQNELAARSGVAQSEISRIERGRGNPTHATLAILLAALGARLSVVRDGGGGLTGSS